MPKKWNLQDIRPTDSERRQRAVVPVSQTTAPQPRPGSDMRRKPPVQTPPPVAEEEDPDISSIIIQDGNGAKKKRIFVSVIVAALIIAGGIGASMMLRGAEVAINPKYKDVTVGATIVAKTAPSAGELGYELLTLEASGERQVSATGKETVSERTEGTIFIYNAYSDATQRLIKNTRFESPEGLIFRISESVEVPGKTTDSSGNTVPGVIQANVFADGTGEQYNLEPSRFTIPGLKGTDQYATMYAESKQTFTGGFEGDKYIIDNAELDTAKQALHTELRDALLARLDKERPAGFVLYENSITFTYETLPATEYGDQMATIKEIGRLQVPIFKADDFSRYIAKESILGFENAPVAITDPYALTFAYTDPLLTRSDISGMTELSFDLAGNAEIVWQFDEEKLKNDLRGVSKSALPSILSAYPAIERAEATIRPFWKNSFPEKVEEIKLLVQLSR